MALLRLKKFERSKEPLKGLAITARDLAIMADIADYRFLDAEQILALHPGSLRNTQNRLSLLYHRHYLDRPKSQRNFAEPSKPLIYSLYTKGAELLGRPVRRKKIGGDYIAHAMMISNFHCALSLALKLRPDQPKISRWVQGYELRDLLAKRGRPKIVPDAFFSIIKVDGEKRQRWNFFLEVDRGTENRGEFLAKMETYWNWRSDERLLQVLDITKYFRVLTIAPTKARKESLRAVSGKATEGQETSRFLFLSEKDFSLKNPEAVLSPLWLSPKDNAPHSLLE